MQSIVVALVRSPSPRTFLDLVSISFPIRTIYLKATPMAVFKRKLPRRSGK